jgi:prepilin-type N-terminal cleavage/methylation domain-containing protein
MFRFEHLSGAGIGYQVLLGITIKIDMNKTKGFTLIELLVVIAIIGILSSVVLASLSTARNKGADATVKANLSNARAQAENFYDSATPNSYAGVCTNTTTGIMNMLTGAQNASGAASINTTLGTAGTVGTVVTCHDSATGWAAQAPLKAAGTNMMFCVDSTGTSTVKATAIAASAVVCP